MDARIKRIFVSITLFLCLVACSSLPPQDFKFSLNSEPPNISQWSKSGLASAGSLTFRFRLREYGMNAADVRISLGDFDKQNPMLRLHINDKRCVGAYAISISYRVSSKEQRTIYPKTRLLWGEDSTLSIHWDKKGKATININNTESQVIDLENDLETVRVEVSRGGIDVEELTYRDFKNSIN